MNDLLTDWKNAAIALLGTLVTILGWIGRGALRRIEHLERTSVAKSDLKELHQENLGNFDEVKALIRRSDEDAMKSRHRLADTVGILTGQVAKVEGRLDEIAKRLP